VFLRLCTPTYSSTSQLENQPKTYEEVFVLSLDSFSGKNKRLDFLRCIIGHSLTGHLHDKAHSVTVLGTITPKSCGFGLVQALLFRAADDRNNQKKLAPRI
jgi:hypothetical protein